jgi:hypothetical protein
MNLSAPNLSHSSTRSTASSNGGKAVCHSSADEGQGGFEQVFAGLAQAGAGTDSSIKMRNRDARAKGSDREIDSETEPRSQDETESGINSKKKKVGEPTVIAALVQLVDPVPAKILPTTDEMPSATEPNVVPDPLAETAAADLGACSEMSGEPQANADAAPKAGGQAATAGQSPQAADVSSARPTAAAAERANELTPTDEARHGLERLVSAAKTPSQADPATAAATEGKPEKTMAALAGETPPQPRSRRLSESTKKPSAADFAETQTERLAGDTGSMRALPKNFLNAARKAVTYMEESVGTNVANSGSEMSSAPAAPILENVFSKDTLPPRVDTASADFSGLNSNPSETPVLTGAHHAIEAVLAAGERFTIAGQRAVKMDFNVSGENLSVHVEMHAGEVRTTFHTASAELQNALTHEWQVLAAADAGRSQRFADPVFSTNSPSGTTQGNGGESQGNPRGQEMYQPRERFEFSPRSGPADPVPRADLPASLPASIPLTPLRLHTFA